ncbi:rap guanine nucleotide exchange factor 4 isoform X1 [Mucor ambiguus]|uniref:Rap guanine nucleotide exchange factor 4 isoform X1 n=1 Tax=Mucor ambiguus TaxID=91626 RepID=A0A0C9M961_9FUNG|nr:rap guanine nucleotide exchange factor 4 isoform X1 [Mucor ambiguus]
MRSIHSLKSRPAFPMTLLPHRQLVEPMNSEQPPKKKRIFYDRINEEDLYPSDESSWDDTSSSHSSTAAATAAKTNNTATIRSLFASQHSGTTTSKATKRASRGIRDLFQSSSHTLKDGSQYTATKKKRESISTLFGSNHSRKQVSHPKLLATKEAENQQSQGSLYSSSSTATSLSTCSTESMNQHFETMLIDDDGAVTNHAKSHLIPPFAKKTNIHWSMEEEDVSQNWRNQRALYRVESIHPQHEEHGEDEEEADSEDSYNQALVATTLKREKSRKRRSNGSLVPAPVKALLSAPMTRENSPLPPLPTVENFLTIMNAPTSPDSSYFSARSVSSNSSSQSTLHSILLDDVTDGLASTHIMEPCLSSDSHSSSGASSMTVATKKADVTVTIKSPPSSTTSSDPPPVPPKDRDLKRMLTMDPQDNATTNINNKQEKRNSITMDPETLKRVHSSKKKKTVPSTTEMRITTSDISNNHAFFAPKSADATSTFRPPIPPRRSSMPLPPPKFDSNAAVPPLPVDAKKKADAYSRRPSKLDDASSWTSFLGLKKEEPTANNTEKRAKLGRSLGAAAPKKAKKSDSNNLLKVTENGQVVLLYEMVHGKLQVIAGTTERLFEKLADETAQDMEYVDTFLMNYASFTTSIHLLNQLISRFHLGPLPGEYEYFKKWQHSIQSKVLTVIDRWVTLQYQDFKYDLDLQKKLNLFLFNNDTVLLQQFRQQVEKIQYNLKIQIQQFSNHQHHVSMITANQHVSAPPSNAFNFHFSFGNSSQYLPTTVHTNNTSTTRRPSNSLFSSSSSITPELPTQIHDSSSLKTTLHTSLVSLESKDIARYLTLADFYLFKSIQSRELISNSNHKAEINYTELMTKRANMLSHWVVHEICSISYLKPKRSLLKKFIEIAKLCLEFNNFHTCMVITMGLASAPKLKDVWETLSNRDTNTFASLQKLLNVSMNMRYYRQKIQLAKAPSIPFLPVVLKDQTFFRENSTFLISHPHLVNFAKFTSIRQFVDKTKALTRENYYFSNELTRYPFFSLNPSENSTTTSSEGSLDCIADWVEDRLSQVQSCYLHCDLLSKL